MEQHKLEITLEQRDWERLQKLSERNGESMERLVARLLAADLANIFNKPKEIPWSSEVRKVYESFVEGRTQTKASLESQEESLQSQETAKKTIGELTLNMG